MSDRIKVMCRVIDAVPKPLPLHRCNEDGTLVGERYFVGIIDILMLYTRRKRLERLWKSSTEGAISQGGVGGCSSQPPAKYAIRFCKWIDNMTE